MARSPPCFAPDGLGYGDINGDGYVTEADAELVSRHVVGLAGATLTPAQQIRADVNNDGEVTGVDAMLIGKYAEYVEGYDTFPICSVEPVDCARCDFNGDGIVDINDEILIGAAYGSRPGDANWDPMYDLNGDGVVDYKDMAMFGACFGTVTCPTPECSFTIE